MIALKSTRKTGVQCISKNRPKNLKNPWNDSHGVQQGHHGRQIKTYESTPGKMFRPRHPAKKAPAIIAIIRKLHVWGRALRPLHPSTQLTQLASSLRGESNCILHCSNSNNYKKQKQKQNPATRDRYITYISLRTQGNQTNHGRMKELRKNMKWGATTRNLTSVILWINEEERPKLDQTWRKEKISTQLEACKSQTLGKKRIQGKPNQNKSPEMVGKHKATKHPKKQIKFMLSFVIVCQSNFIASTINHLSTSCAGFLGADNVGFRRAECSGPIAGHIPPRGEGNQANSFTADVLPMRPTGWTIFMRSCMELELFRKKRVRSCSWWFLKISEILYIKYIIYHVYLHAFVWDDVSGINHFERCNDESIT